MRKIGGLIALVLIVLMVITGCDNSTANNSNSDKYYKYLLYLQQLGQQQKPDSDWYFADPDATEYTLTTVQELQGLFALVNSGEDNFEGQTINLKNGEYDLSGIEAPNKGTSFIGYGDRKGAVVPFAGTFNGNDAVIKGVDLSYLASASDSAVGSDGEDNMGVGFFGVVKGTSGSPAVVRNLTFEGCTLISTSNTTGIAVGYAENANIFGITVKNCEITGPQGVGGVVGRLYNSGEISGCEVIDTTIAASDDDVDYEGAGTGNYNAGGIVGCASYNDDGTGPIHITNNIVDLSGDGSISATDKNAGGICGHAGMANVNFAANRVVLAKKTQIDAPDGKGALYGYAPQALKLGNDNYVKIGGGSEDLIDKSTNVSKLN